MIFQVNQDEPNKYYRVDDIDDWNNFKTQTISDIENDEYSAEKLQKNIGEGNFVEIKVEGSNANAYTGMDKVAYEVGCNDGINGEKADGGDVFVGNPSEQKTFWRYQKGYDRGESDREDKKTIEIASQQTANFILENGMITVNTGESYIIFERIDDKWVKRVSYSNQRSRTPPAETIPYNN